MSGVILASIADRLVGESWLAGGAHLAHLSAGPGEVRDAIEQRVLSASRGMPPILINFRGLVALQ